MRCVARGDGAAYPSESPVRARKRGRAPGRGGFQALGVMVHRLYIGGLGRPVQNDRTGIAHVATLRVSAGKHRDPLGLGFLPVAATPSQRGDTYNMTTEACTKGPGPPGAPDLVLVLE
eukprot:scaffold2280_cov430-Prasinococcus_capsulatus_cf.AAC.13